MKKITTLLACFLLLGTFAKAQQDAMFTKYMFNSLSYNPAYAGSKEHMSLGLLHRSQWVGIEGAPQTQSFTMHTPLSNNRVGIGMNIMNDKIGPSNNLFVGLDYAYRIKIGSGKLSLGLQGSIENWRADWTLLSTEDVFDPEFNTNPNSWLPNFGAGLYYYTKVFYLGASVPKLIQNDLTPAGEKNNFFVNKGRRHYYLTGGVAIPLNGEDLILRPSMLVKSVGIFDEEINAPTEFDVDVSLLFYQTFWVGVSFRSAFDFKNSSNDSVDFWASYNLPNGLTIGAAFDYTLTKLESEAKGSFELMVGYEFDYKTKRTVTPRYF